MIKKTMNRICTWKISTQFAVLILCALLTSFAVFETLWINKQVFFHLAGLDDYYFNESALITLSDELYKQAPNYELPESENDKERIEALKPLLNLADDYTDIAIYGLDDGYYRTSKEAEIWRKYNFFPVFYTTGELLFSAGMTGFQYIPLQFSNGSGNAFITNYKRSVVLYPYAIGCISVSILLFFSIILFFISRKMKSVLTLEKEVLIMSSGDLSHPVPDFGGDEIGVLAKELDNMRITLNDNIEKEQESRQANQDLITALSHDLRTPLTILNGYLEVLKLKKNPKLEDEYLTRCLKKTKDLKELTDKMFEYSLVSEENETASLSMISADFIRQCLQENADFIRLAGFKAKLLLDSSATVIRSDKTMFKRILNNLFSNIFKYGDKKETVTISFCIQKNTFTVTIENAVKKEHACESGSNIGLKSVQKMMSLLGGELHISQTSEMFTAKLDFQTGI